MIVQFVIFDKAGIVYWTHNNTSLGPINSLIGEVLIGERSQNQEHTLGNYTFQWRFSTTLEVYFVAVVDKILANSLRYVPSLLKSIQLEVENQYGDRLKRNPTILGSKFSNTFEEILSDLDQTPQKSTSKPVVTPTPKDESTTQPKEVTNSTEEPKLSGLERLKLKSKKKTTGSSKKNTPQTTTQPSRKGKTGRVWDDAPVSKKDKKLLDFSNPNQQTQDSSQSSAEFIESLDFEEESDEEEVEDEPSNWTGGLMKYIRNITQKELKESDLNPILTEMKNHLISKNVAFDISEQLCDSVKKSLLGKSHTSFKSISNTVKAAMEEVLTRILTPTRSVDIAREIIEAKREGRPYSIVFVGVNGVGKSTTLSKVCAWLLKQKFTVMIAGCDTFRSGAVEQLKTHANKLGVPLYDQGYGKDPATIAQVAVRKAKEQGIDVVLIDTAGRMQDNEPLMKALGKLVFVNKPDLVLFVGEALVGNDSVDQLKKFNHAIREYGGEGVKQIDGIVLTKFDTVDDKVGAAISMVHTTGQPIIFIGVGQSYSDLKTLNVNKIVNILAKGST